MKRTSLLLSFAPDSRSILISIAAALITCFASAIVLQKNAVAAGGDNPVPMLISLNPTAVNAGSVAFTLTANGANFVSGSVIRFNGEDRPTTFISATELRTLIPATDVLEPGAAIVTVFNPEPGGGESDPLTFGINDAQNAAPTITSINPNQVTAGGDAFTMTVTGIDFAPGIVVRVNGQDRVTEYVSGGELRATITASDVAAHGSRTITVFNPPPGGGESEPFFLTVLQPPNPAPSITSINPTLVDGGGTAFTLEVDGSNFVSNSAVHVDGNPRATTFVSSLRVTATITADDIATGGTRNITVVNPAPGGGTSNAVSLQVTDPPNPVPTITSLNPGSVTAGGPQFTLEVNGTNFVNGSTVHFQGSQRSTTFVNATKLEAVITAADIASTGSAGISVVNPAPGGGTSNQQLLTITPNCSYTVTPVDRSFSAAGGQGTITVTTLPGCNWTAETTFPWITLEQPASGSGSGTVNFTVAENTASAIRQATIVVGDQTFTVLQGLPFLDVDPTNPFYEFIGKISARGVTLGCAIDGEGNRSYCPSGTVTREQMAAFLIRALGMPNPPVPETQRFADVPPESTFYGYIDQMAIRGITTGCSIGFYCPVDTVTREQMAAFLIRALGMPNPPVPETQRFADVPPHNFFYSFIEQMAVRGVTLGCGDGNYCPSGLVTREQMAAFLVRAFDL